MDYKKLGLKCGIEIHQQLEGKKLFCECPTTLRDDAPDFTIQRKIRASAGESGKVDVAAAQEQLRNKIFIYQGYNDTTCLVEADEEPPHSVNETALFTSLQFCLLVGGRISPIVQVMRKTVADGSNTSGFQRTALIARGGKISTSLGEVGIANISIEEDAGKIVSEETKNKTYKLDRLGIPLIEIGTEPDIKTPDQCQEAAKKLGMLLRSLSGIKRGLGTIRQDVNVSIRGGVRIEIKGAQDIKQVPMLVELEAKRQLELLKIKDELRTLRLNEYEVADVSLMLQDLESRKIQHALERGEVVLGMKLHGFSGLLGRELQPGYRIGTELSGRAKVVAGVKGLFHSDELPAYGITEREIKLIRKKLKCTTQDGFVLVMGKKEIASLALKSVYARVKELFVGVPKEVRKANSDGTSSFMRPMPGAARMYPETDVPLIRPQVDGIELPELLDVKTDRFVSSYGLSRDLAAFMAKSARRELFEELAKKYKDMKAAFIAETLTSTPVEIKRKYGQETNLLNDDSFRDLFKYLDEDKIHKDIVLDVLLDMCKSQFDLQKYASLSTEDLHQTIAKIIDENKGAPLGALMGKCMKALAGKASGQVISQMVKKIVTEGHE